MKNFYFLFLISFLAVSCSKEELDLNVQEVNATYDACAMLAGPDNSVDVTIEQIEKKYNRVSRLTNLFYSLLGDDVSSGGVFSPSIEEMAAMYRQSPTKFGAYTTTYTLTEGDCTDSAEITVNVVPECNASAGRDYTTLVLSYQDVDENYNSLSRLEVLYRSMLEEGVSEEGTFEPTIEEIGLRYANAVDKKGYYETVYTVGTGDCTDSAVLGITVVDGNAECTVNAGADNSVSISNEDIKTHYFSLSRLNTLYRSLLEEGVSSSGNFNPTIEELAARYQNAADKTGAYTTTYTVVDGLCSDSVDLTVVITE